MIFILRGVVCAMLPVNTYISGWRHELMRFYVRDEHRQGDGNDLTRILLAHLQLTAERDRF